MFIASDELTASFYPNIEGYGRMKLIPGVDDYFYYDGPHLIQTVSASGHDFLAALVDEEMVEDVAGRYWRGTWIYTLVTQATLQGFWDGKISLEEIFGRKDGLFWRHQLKSQGLERPYLSTTAQ